MAPSSAAELAVLRSSRSVSSEEELDTVALEAAAAEGDTSAVQRIIGEAKIDLAAHADLLYVCCERGHADVAALMIAARVPVDQRLQTTLYSPLHVAAHSCHAGVVEVLLAGRSDIDVRARHGITPLLCASGRAAGTPVVRLLLAAGASVDAARDSGCTPLYAAASSGHTDITQLLLENKAAADALMQPLRNAAPGGIVSTALFASCVNGHLDDVRLLLEARAVVNRSLIQGGNALHAAAAKGNTPMVRLLLGFRADVVSVKLDGTTPLSAAALAGHVGCLAALLNAGARDLPAGAPPVVKSAMDAACSRQDAGHRACAELLRRAAARYAKAAEEAAAAAAAAAVADAAAANITVVRSTAVRGMSQEAPPCKCAAQMAATRRVTKKAGPNQGRPFWACGRSDAHSCNFFSWAGPQLAADAESEVGDGEEAPGAHPVTPREAPPGRSASGGKGCGSSCAARSVDDGGVGGGETCGSSAEAAARMDAGPAKGGGACVAAEPAAEPASGASSAKGASSSAAGASSSAEGPSSSAQGPSSPADGSSPSSSKRSSEESALAVARAEAAAEALIAEVEAERLAGRLKGSAKAGGRKSKKNRRGAKGSPAPRKPSAAGPSGAAAEGGVPEQADVDAPMAAAFSAIRVQAEAPPPEATAAEVVALPTQEAAESIGTPSAADADGGSAVDVGTVVGGDAAAAAVPSAAAAAAVDDGDEEEDDEGSPSSPRQRSADDIPDAFLCPITQDYMKNPVVTADGQTYERVAIERWLERQRVRGLSCTSPLTGEVLEHTQLVPNVALRGLIRDLLERRPELLCGAAFANV